MMDRAPSVPLRSWTASVAVQRDCEADRLNVDPSGMLVARIVRRISAPSMPNGSLTIASSTRAGAVWLGDRTS